MAGLIKGWSPVRLEECLNYPLAIDENTDDGLRKAYSKFPEVLTTWRIDPNAGVDDFSTSFQPGTQKAPVSRPVLPHLLSFRGAGNGFNDYAASHYTIHFEVKVDGEWLPGPEFDGLEVWDDGTIYVPGLREQVFANENGSWHWTNQSGQTKQGPLTGLQILDITPNDIRATLAYPSDVRTFVFGKSAKSTLSQDNIEVDFLVGAEQGPDDNRITKGLNRMHLIDAGNLYHLWMRNDSYPVPESLGAAKANGTLLRNDLPLLRAHTKRKMYDLGHLQKKGRLRMDGWLVAGYSPGTEISHIKKQGVPDQPFQINGVINAVIMRHRVVDKRTKVVTELEIQ